MASLIGWVQIQNDPCCRAILKQSPALINHDVMWKCPGGQIDIKIASYQYRNSHYKVKTGMNAPFIEMCPSFSGSIYGWLSAKLQYTLELLQSCIKPWIYACETTSLYWSFPCSVALCCWGGGSPYPPLSLVAGSQEVWAAVKEDS